MTDSYHGDSGSDLAARLGGLQMQDSQRQVPSRGASAPPLQHQADNLNSQAQPVMRSYAASGFPDLPTYETFSYYTPALSANGFSPNNPYVASFAPMQHPTNSHASYGAHPTHTAYILPANPAQLQSDAQRHNDLTVMRGGGQHHQPHQDRSPLTARTYRPTHAVNREHPQVHPQTPPHEQIYAFDGGNAYWGPVESGRLKFVRTAVDAIGWN